MQRVARSLVVEDDPDLQRVLKEVLEARSDVVKVCDSVCEAGQIIAAFRPELVVLDFQLKDGEGSSVLKDLWAQPQEEAQAPVFVAISGTASPDVTFQLAQLGVRAYATKPLELASFNATLDRALREGPDLKPHLRTTVGQRAIHEVEAEVRETMVKEAVVRSGGSRRGAARLLDISRQLLQHMLRKL